MKSKEWLSEDEAFSPINPDAVPPAPKTDPMDLVTMDVPLLIRLFELMKETVKDDAELHELTTQLLNVSKSANGPLTMEHYNEILNGKSDVEEAVNGEQCDDDMVNDIIDLGSRYFVKEKSPTFDGYNNLKKFYDAVTHMASSQSGEYMGYQNLSKDKNLPW